MQPLHMPLPIGPTVTFLFTDIEGSTRLERAIGSAAWSAVVGRHDALLREAIDAAGGIVVKTEGDAFFAAFADAHAAVRAAITAQRAIAAEGAPSARPATLAAEAFGAAAAAERLRAGGAIPVADIVAEILAAPPPSGAATLSPDP
jgi:class 3 adenylate cyclase